MAEKFSSLSKFLAKTKSIEQATIENAINASTDETVQRILNDSSVRLSLVNQLGNGEETQTTDKSKATAEFIQQSVKEAVQANSNRVKSILDDVFKSVSVSVEREEFWINKLCALFNIDSDLPTGDKAALIDRQLSIDPDTLNYVVYLVESGEKKSQS